MNSDLCTKFLIHLRRGLETPLKFELILANSFSCFAAKLQDSSHPKIRQAYSAVIEPKLLHMITVLQVGNILTSHVSYGAILARNSTDFLKCFNEYVQTEEQWLYYILAENTGTTQVGLTKEAATIF